MFKAAFVSAFVLTVVTYAVFYYFQPACGRGRADDPFL